MTPVFIGWAVTVGDDAGLAFVHTKSGAERAAYKRQSRRAASASEYEAGSL